MADSFEEDVVKLVLKLKVLNSANVLKNMDVAELQRSMRALGDDVVLYLGRSPEEKEAMSFAVIQSLASAFADLNTSYLPKLAAVMTEKNASRITHVCSRLGDPVFLRAILSAPEYESTRSDLAQAIESSRSSADIALPIMSASAPSPSLGTSLSSTGAAGSAADSASAGSNGGDVSAEKTCVASTFVLLG